MINFLCNIIILKLGCPYFFHQWVYRGKQCHKRTEKLLKIRFIAMFAFISFFFVYITRGLQQSEHFTVIPTFTAVWAVGVNGIP